MSGISAHISFPGYNYNYRIRDFIFAKAIFSIWHILILVRSNMSPISCSVKFDFFEAIKTQFIFSFDLHQYLHDFFLQDFPDRLCSLKQVVFLTVSILLSPIDNNNISIQTLFYTGF